MQFETPEPRGHIIHHKDRSLRLGVPVTIVVDKPKFSTNHNINYNILDILDLEIPLLNLVYNSKQIK